MLSKPATQMDDILERIFEYCFCTLPNIDHILLCAPLSSGFHSTWFTQLHANKKQNVGILPFVSLNDLTLITITDVLKLDIYLPLCAHKDSANTFGKTSKSRRPRRLSAYFQQEV